MEYGKLDSSFIAAGGEEGLFRLATEFYRQMEHLEQAQKIRAMHPKDLEQSIDKLARFLSGWLGGPKLYRERYGSISIPQAHAHLSISTTERDAWLLCMEQALTVLDYPINFKRYLLQQLSMPANRCVNQ